MSQFIGNPDSSGVSKTRRRRWALLILLVVLVLGVAAAWGTYRATQAQAAPAQERYSIVGAWLVDAQHAPFVQHVMIFNTDGTVLIDNPEAGDPHSSDSVGAGAWERDPRHADAIVGQFQEINADRSTGQFVSRLVVTFSLTMQGGDAFSGPAGATYYNPDGTKQNNTPYPATLIGTRIDP